MTGILILALLAAVTFLFYKYVTRNYGYLESLGLPVIAPVWCFGSPPFRLHKVVAHDDDVQTSQRMKTMTWGRYDGCQATIYTMDPELLKEVMVTNFDAFRDRELAYLPEDYVTLDVASGEAWKTLRKALSPTFTSGKLKSMLDPIGAQADKFIAHLRHKMADGDGSVDVRPVLQALTMDVIGKCAYNVEFNCLTDDAINEPEIFKATKSLVETMRVTSDLMSAFFLLIFTFPSLYAWSDDFPKAMFDCK